MKLQHFCLLGVLLAGPHLSAFAQAGFLDPSFGGTGLTQVTFGGFSDYGQVTAAQRDGQLLVAGSTQSYVGGAQQIVVLRLGANNVPDPAFGTNGVTSVTPPNSLSSVVAMAEQADGKIVLATTQNIPGTDGSIGAISLMRLNTNGSLDMSFGYNGFTYSWDYNGYSTTCHGMVLQPDGKSVVVGTSGIENFNEDLSYMIVLRYDTNGLLDSSFGSSGTYVGASYSVGNSVGLRGDGDILVGGGATSMGDGVFAFTTNGVLDTAFGSGGATSFTSINSITAVTIQPAGIEVSQRAMILAAASSGLDIIVARMSLAGALDTSFGGTGYVTKQISSSEPPTVTGMIAFRTGNPFSFIIKIVIGGGLNYTTDFMATCLNADGSTYTNFGTAGIVVTPIPGASAASAYGFTTVNGDLVVSGGESGSAPCSEDFVVARYGLLTGVLDTNFYGSGILTTNFGNLNSAANSVAVQGDGKIVVAGYCNQACDVSMLALCRLNSDSTLDASFGAGGKVITAFGGQTDRQTPVVIQPDGRIVVAGAGPGSLMVARFLTNGTLDGSFGSGGVATNLTGSYPNSIALQNDGRILVGAGGSFGANDIAILRFTSNGVPDTTWNSTGAVVTAIGLSDTMSAVAVQKDGKVVNSGFSGFTSTADFSMVRCNTNGVLDNSFGSFGRDAVGITGQPESGAFAMALQPDRKILLAGVTINSSSQEQIALMRFNTNGSVDATFGTNGVTIADIGFGNCLALSVSLQADGKIVAACRAQIGPVDQFSVARFLTNGVLDSGYGFNGVNYFDFGTGGNEDVNGMAIDSFQRMVMVGTAGNQFAIARVNGDPLLRFTSITALPNQDILLTGLGIPGVPQTLLETPNLGAGFSPIATITPDASGNWQYQDTNAPASRQGIYRLSYP